MLYIHFAKYKKHVICDEGFDLSCLKRGGGTRPAGRGKGSSRRGEREEWKGGGLRDVLLGERRRRRGSSWEGTRGVWRAEFKKADSANSQSLSHTICPLLLFPPAVDSAETLQLVWLSGSSHLRGLGTVQDSFWTQRIFFSTLQHGGHHGGICW